MIGTNAEYTCVSKKDFKLNDNTVEIENNVFKLVTDITPDYVEIKGYDCVDNCISIRKRDEDIIAIIVYSYDVELYYDSCGVVYAKDLDEAWTIANATFGDDVLEVE